ncbi:hypothetical protein F2981_25005 (plasmid) [Sinorhizobium meliloti]|nr:hypothetical protein [Sinorhizobium meliloti]
MAGLISGQELRADRRCRRHLARRSGTQVKSLLRQARRQKPDGASSNKRAAANGKLTIAGGGNDGDNREPDPVGSWEALGNENHVLLIAGRCLAWARRWRSRDGRLLPERRTFPQQGARRGAGERHQDLACGLRQRRARHHAPRRTRQFELLGKTRFPRSPAPIRSSSWTGPAMAAAPG